MNKKNFVECERNRLQKILGFRLPTSSKWLGVILLVLAFGLFFVRKEFLEHADLLQGIGRTIFIIGLLCVSLAKDREEDEMTIALRAQSYAIAFILGALYAIVMPYVEFGVSNIVSEEAQSYKQLGDFQLLSFMFLVQLGFYYTLKRYR